ncbi:hypothetical protein X738_33105 [Mesorhizobium sp. LNHC209A00]|nr:hypothetical protein X738_33105 [Mesorhizobium sp. LNHC209A00]
MAEADRWLRVEAEAVEFADKRELRDLARHERVELVADRRQLQPIQDCDQQVMI